jgi:tetratricopeptide (TPR) repeat protein
VTAGTRRVVLGLTILALVAGGAWLTAAWWRPSAPTLPDVDLADADPAVIRAVELARQAVLSRPRSADAWGRLGMVLAAHGFHPAAAPCFAEAERLEPHEVRWPYFHGVALAVYDPDAALPSLRRAAALSGRESAAPRLRLAEVLLAQGRAEEAGELFRSLLAADTGNGRAHLGLARLAMGRTDETEGLAHLEAAAANPTTRKAAQTLLAEVYQRRGGAEAAARAARRAADLPEDSEPPDPYLDELESYQVGRQAQLARASKLLRQGREREAVALMRETVRDYPDGASGWLGLGRALVQARDYRGAEQALREAVRLNPDLVEGYFYLGVSHFERGDHLSAAPAFRRATELRPDYALAYYNLGHCLKRQGDRPGALAAFREAVRLKPHFAQAHSNLGELLIPEGRPEEAREHLRLAVALDPGDARARDLLAQLSRQGR